MPPGAGRAALQTTKRLLRRRTWCLVLAWFFTGLPLSFSVDGSGLGFLLLRDESLLNARLLVATGMCSIAKGSASFWLITLFIVTNVIATGKLVTYKAVTVKAVTRNTVISN